MIERFSDRDELADAAADAIDEVLASALVRRHALFVATGGSTPGPVYDRLASYFLHWPSITVTLTDERWVETDSPDSNERLIKDRLLVTLGTHARFVSLKTDAATPEVAALKASAALAALGPPDAVLLGMGEDGHIASLFPGSPALAAGLDPAAPACIAVPQGQGRPPAQARLSLTAPWLATARQIVIMITGETKLGVIERAIAGADPFELPVRAILNSQARVRILWSH